MKQSIIDYLKQHDQLDSKMKQNIIAYLSGNEKSESQLKQTIVDYLNEHDQIDDAFEYAQSQDLDYQEFVGSVLSLHSSQIVVQGPNIAVQSYILTDEGLEFVSEGSTEFRLFNDINNGDSLADIRKSPCFTTGWPQLMKRRLVKLDKKTKTITKNTDSIEDVTVEQLKKVSMNDIEGVDIATLKKRNLLTLKTFSTFSVTKGPRFTTKMPKEASELTSEALVDDAWKEMAFKEYNIDSMGAPIQFGRIHPLMKVREEYRRIFFELGFEEMPTNRFVESSFWNFDTLFQPQQHPARDAHDTFFLSKPKYAHDIPKDYFNVVKNTHEVGGFGSVGWRYIFSDEEAMKNVLRTHTTAVSSRMLYKLAKEGFQPKKYFSIDRVFRNETLDATHLAEFHQVEGLVADYDLSLRDLMGMLATFFQKIGIKQLRFKPAYNPYTEPSMEVFGYHPGLGKWIEIGNSGVFRPEMLRPMGLPENVTVIAWGLSLERPTMIKYGIDNIRDLVGYKSKIAL